jgi:hypothetical protein
MRADIQEKTQGAASWRNSRVSSREGEEDWKTTKTRRTQKRQGDVGAVELWTFLF